MIKQLTKIPLGVLAAGLVSGTVANADIQQLDDVIIGFSLCVGNDCVNGESFGFDTIRMKENNVRFHFDDTSNSASFPQNDWRLIANDSSNGGGNYFAIEDSTAGRQVFRVDAGAPANSLRVDSAGDVGIGTDNAVVELHVVDGDSPTLRLEQNGSSGFTPQTFDMVSNEANFFIRDVTNGSQLPFRIVPGADTNALHIGADNDIGIGTNSPSNDFDGIGTDASVHMRSSDGSSGLFVEEINSTDQARVLAGFRNNGAVIMQLADSSAGGIAWNIQNRGDISNNFQIVNAAGTGDEFILSQNGDLTITGTLTTAAGNTCAAGCDRVFDADYERASIEEHAKAMWENNHLPAVGPTDETGPINITEKIGRMLNELEHAHIYIEQLHERLEVLETKLAQVE